MIFSLSNDGIQWSLDNEPDSAILTVKDLVQEITMSSQEIPLQLGTCYRLKDKIYCTTI